MKWKITFSKTVEKSFQSGQFHKHEVVAAITMALNRLRGKSEPVDIKKLRGQWEGYYRIKLSRQRIIFTIQFASRTVYIERIASRDIFYR